MQITVNNSYSTIEGYDRPTFDKIRKLLSYVDSSRYRIGKFPIRKYMMDKRGSFPTGLLTMLKSYLIKSGVTFSIADKRKRPLNGPPSSIYCNMRVIPYPDQQKAATAALERNRGIIVAPTGSGKSMIIKLILSKLKVKTLIIVPTVELKKQLTLDLQDFFTSKANIVGPLVNKHNKYFYTVENIDQLSDSKVKIDADCLIIDEFHRSASTTYQKLNKIQWNGIYYRFGLTATPFRSKNEEKILLAAILEDVIYKLNYEDAVNKQYIVPAEAYYVELPKVKLTSTNSFESVYKQVIESDERMAVIQALINSAVRDNTSTLVLVKRIEHGVRIQDQAKRLNNIDIPFAQGINENNAEIITLFSRGEVPVLIGTVGVLGEGIDTKACEYVVLAGGGKSRNQFHQNIGRAFRKFSKNKVDKQSAKIVMFKDTSHKWMLDHFNACVKYLKEDFKIVPIKINF